MYHHYLNKWNAVYTYKEDSEQIKIEFSKQNSYIQIIGSVIICPMLLAINHFFLLSNWFAYLTVLIVFISVFANVKKLFAKPVLLISLKKNNIIVHGFSIGSIDDISKFIVNTTSKYNENGITEVFIELNKSKQILLMSEGTNRLNTCTIDISNRICDILKIPIHINKTPLLN